MKTFRELCGGKIHVAVQAMVDGLRNQNERSDFRIDMDTFGEYTGSICFGCAATCAVQQITGVQFNDARIIYARERVIEHDIEDLADFECAIDSIRKGSFAEIAEYFNKEIPDVFYYVFGGTWHLGDYDWEQQLPGIEDFIAKLKELNL